MRGRDTPSRCRCDRQTRSATRAAPPCRSSVCWPGPCPRSTPPPPDPPTPAAPPPPGCAWASPNPQTPLWGGFRGDPVVEAPWGAPVLFWPPRQRRAPGPRLGVGRPPRQLVGQGVDRLERVAL